MVFPMLYYRFSLVIYFVHGTNVYKIDIYQCTYVYSNLPIHPNPPLVSICSLHLCLYFCFVNKIVYTNFFPQFYIYALIFRTCFSHSDLLLSVVTLCEPTLGLLYPELFSTPTYLTAITMSKSKPKSMSAAVDECYV